MRLEEIKKLILHEKQATSTEQDNLVKKISENVSSEYNIDDQALVQDQLLCAQENEEFKDVLQRIVKTLTFRVTSKSI